MKETGIKRKSKKKISYLILALVGALSLSQIFLPSPTKENYFSLNIKDDEVEIKGLDKKITLENIN